MTDNYESRLRARLGALERAVPVSGETARTGQAIHRGTRVRSALPVGSLVAAGLIALVVVGLVPRLAPSGSGASPSGSGAGSSGASASVAATGTDTPSPSASLVIGSPIAPIRASSISKIDWTTVPLPAGVNVDTTSGNITATAQPMVAGLGGNLVMLAMAGAYSLDLTTLKWTKLAGQDAFGGYVPLSGLIEDGRGGLMAWGSEGIFQSRDGRTWQKTLTTDPDVYDIQFLIETPTGYLAVGNPPGEPPVVLTSADGAVWTRRDLPDAANWTVVQVFLWHGQVALDAVWSDPEGEQLIAGKVPVRPTRIWLSSDGASWEAKSVLTGFYLPRFVTLNKITVAYEGMHDTTIQGIPILGLSKSPLSSTNLSDWHRVTVTPATGFTAGVDDIELLGSELIAAEPDGWVLTSGDGVSWTLQESSGPSEWVHGPDLTPVGGSLVDTTAKLPSGKPALLILTPLAQ
jgi:hypothetical protein